jgi:hypothetical protein
MLALAYGAYSNISRLAGKYQADLVRDSEGNHDLATEDTEHPEMTVKCSPSIGTSESSVISVAGIVPRV